MRIDRLHLQDFGQFHHKDVTLASGINIVYGANEAGKTTMKDFIVDMLYGIDKARGIGARFDHYEQKKPINGSAFSGAMEISTDGADYLIERNFARQEKKTTVRDLDTGREIALQEANSLMGTILQTDKSTYINTLCISQMGAATDKDIAEKLNNYIVNMASTRIGDLNAVNAIMELKNKKKEFSNKELEHREQELTTRLSLNRDFDAELTAIKDEYDRLEASMKGEKPEQLQFTPIHPNRSGGGTEEVSAESLNTNSKKKSKEIKKVKTAKQPKESASNEDTSIEEETALLKSEQEREMLRNMGDKSILDNIFVILFLCLLFVAMFIGIAYVIPVNIPEIKMLIIGGGTILVLLTTIQILWKRARLHHLLEELEIEQGFQEAKTDAVDVEAQRELVSRLSDLKVKEQSIVKERVEQEQVLEEITKLRKQKEENDIETAALDLAINTIQDLSEEIYDSFGSVLNEQVSEILSRITNNKYSDVKIDDQLKVMVRNGSSYISMDYLSTGTIEQIYLALRLSIANVLVAEDLPIIIDDAFVMYDYQRLYETLSCLGEYLNRQIIIFTANPGIQQMLVELGVESNYVAL